MDLVADRLRERRKTGELTFEKLALAAYAEHPGALRALGRTPARPRRRRWLRRERSCRRELDRWLRGLATFGKDACFEAGLAIAKLAEPRWEVLDAVVRSVRAIEDAASATSAAAAVARVFDALQGSVPAEFVLDVVKAHVGSWALGSPAGLAWQGSRFDLDDEETPVVRLVHRIIEDSYVKTATAIRIAPASDSDLARVTYTSASLDEQRLHFPIDALAPIATRVRFMASLDVFERRAPQTGVLAFRKFSRTGLAIGFRVTLTPGPRGETIELVRLFEGEFLLASDGRRTKYDHERPYQRIKASGGRGWDDLDPAKAGKDQGSYVGFEAFLAREPAPAPGTRALEIGCGGGQVTLRLAQQGFDATGVDFSETAIELARENARTAGVAARFEVGDALTLEGFPDASFSLVLDNHALHCVVDSRDRASLLASVRRVLAPGGRFWSETMSCEGDFDFVRHDVDPGTRVTRNQARIWVERSALESELRAAGLEIVSVEVRPDAPGLGSDLVTLSRRPAQ
jgi:SAM-dependent methyltransferase